MDNRAFYFSLPCTKKIGYEIQKKVLCPHIKCFEKYNVFPRGY